MSLELFHAVHNNDIFHLQEVLMDCDDLDINASTIGAGMSALHVAAEKGYSSVVKVLISAGASVNAKDEACYTPLMNAARAGYPLVVKVLINANCDCNLSTWTGFTALHIAARSGNTCIIQQLLMAGAKIPVWTNSGESPLSFALLLGSVEDVQALLLGYTYADANLLLPSPHCLQPLYKCMKSGNFTVAKTLVLAGYKCIEELQLYLSETTSGHNNNDLDISDDLDLPSSERESHYFLTHQALQPASLQHQCRLSIRKFLYFNIWDKSTQLGLPQRLVEYVCFGDLYHPPRMNTDHEVYTYFAEHTEIY